MNNFEELEKLAKLKDKGIITEEEFNDKRNEILSANNQVIPEKHQKGHGFLSFIVLIISIIAAGLIFKGGYDIGKIHSVGGRSLEEAYYQHLGFVYQGWALFVLAAGIFFSVIIKRNHK